MSGDTSATFSYPWNHAREKQRREEGPGLHRKTVQPDQVWNMLRKGPSSMGGGRKKAESGFGEELVPSTTHSQRCTGAGRGEGRGRLGCGIVGVCVFGWNVTAQSVLSAERYRTCGSEVQVSVWGGVGEVESQSAVHSCGSREARAVRGRDGRWQGKVRRVIHCQKAREQGDKVGCVPRGNIASSAILDVAQVPGFASLGIDCTRFRGSDEGARHVARLALMCAITQGGFYGGQVGHPEGDFAHP